MNEQIYLIPKTGLRVVNPETGRALPAEGAFVNPGSYWIRRVNDGDVSEGRPPRQPKPTIKE